ncbi:DMT family transporter [Sediminicurvatus halobius]|uniref:EamA/RhaT family transporter n=1 Tax=Sediminicurvatus halobius TaxID=2182432 RepID=A0A2U2N9Y0_9GAMM|nr:DMT family transporter [Spiribacter halobius]PWG65784.1 EamA/RhaT family transporter [Spiribacter halobius]UEX77825.1 DMT family transporter [Spiribacter halobius]
MTLLANLTVVTVGVLWGLYWLPLRALDDVATAGPWATLATTVTGLLVLAPAAWRGRGELQRAGWPALASLLLGGASFVLYSNGLLYGHVAVVILLFYLTPVWSTLIGRIWLGQPMTWWRYAAVGVGLVGVALVLRGSHGGLPLPHSAGDWLGLASGIGWAIASVGINRYSRTPPATTNFVFCGGAALAAGLFVLAAGSPPPLLAASALAPAIAWTLVIGGLWWAASLTLFLHAAQRLEPARVGILLMSEVIAGAASAALLTDEPFGMLMGIGAMVVVVAALLETLPAPAYASASEYRT